MIIIMTAEMIVKREEASPLKSTTVCYISCKNIGHIAKKTSSSRSFLKVKSYIKCFFCAEYDFLKYLKICDTDKSLYKVITKNKIVKTNNCDMKTLHNV